MPTGQSDTTLKTTSTSIVRAARVAGEISLDGLLSESPWAAALPVSDFTQREPQEGAPLYDRSPDSTRAQLARRDRITSSDRFLVFLDCYHDRRTGFFFGINAAGTLYDGTLYNDDWNSDTWDGVWEGKTYRDSLGWS